MPKMEEKETPCSWSKRSQSCESTENYLKAILEIRSSHSRCRNVNISRHLNFSRASVSKALVKLSKAGLVKIAEHDVRLTAEGRRIAEELTERYQFFEKLLREAGVDVDEASREACRLEHCVSADSFEKLSSHFRRNRSLGKTVENDETPANPPPSLLGRSGCETNPFS